MFRSLSVPIAVQEHFINYMDHTFGHRDVTLNHLSFTNLVKKNIQSLAFSPKNFQLTILVPTLSTEK